MKNINKYIGISILGIALTCIMSSCNNYLDTLPDNRTELTNPSDVSKLLVSAYSTSYPAYLTEMESDNTDDNVNSNWTESDRFQRQAYEWGDITETSDNETPQKIWERYYTVFSTANTALEFIRSQSDTTKYEAQIGEALMCRAYAGFMLSTVFCNAYDATTASSEYGLPYPVKTETSVGEKYVRGTLAQLYQKIATDIEEALPLISNNYDEPKFHFTKTAAYAFATRFYLYYRQYDKAIAYATKALGVDPTIKLRDWATWNALTENYQTRPNAYVSSDIAANFLLISAYSQWGGIGGPYLHGCKYAHGIPIAQYETVAASGPWGSYSTLNYDYFFNSSLSQVCVRKIGYDFEYTDRTDGIGYAHSIFSAFNAEETLLCRAEAYALEHKYDSSLKDINTIMSKFNHYCTSAPSSYTPLTLDSIHNFYNSIDYYTPTSPTVKKKFHTSFAIESITEEPLLQCIMQLRRLLTIHEGLRWQDIKRYGIVIYRRQVTNGSVTAVTDTLTVDDPRRAIQLPQNIISAGMEANLRNK
jgi:starch-binding outer membrane protein, SusD/RagB family